MCGALGVQMRASDLLEQELQAAVSLEGWELNSCS